MVSVQHLYETMFSASHKKSLFLLYLLNLVLQWYSTKGDESLLLKTVPPILNAHM